MKKNILSIITFLTLSISVNAQIVTIPDANFKAYLVGEPTINTNGDSEIQITEANAFNGAFNCNSLSISDMTGLEAFTSLTELSCGSNSLTTLDVTNNINLTKLYCDHNSLATLDVSQNTSLLRLYCYNNSIVSLDVSNNTSLVRLSCSDNNLSILNVANGNNSNFQVFAAENNSNLACVEVDNVTYSDANWTNIDAGVSFSTACPCLVDFPDANFKAYLVGNGSINTNGDNEIQCTEASAFNGTINCNNSFISDLTGIESFTSITELFCHGNALVSLDVSNNVNLTNLTCNNNSLTSLDVSNNVNLDRIFCQFNSIDSLDVTNNTLLESFRCSNNSISSLDLSNNASLEILRCTDNLLTGIDASNNSNLITFVCSNNNLIELNIANGNNTNIGYNGAIGFVSTGNSNLTCIQVDDVAYSDANWTNIDPQSSFSTNCTVLVNNITVQGQGGVSSITTQNGTLQIEATVLPANADDASYTWSVTDGSGSASIDANGLLTAITDGTVTVTASANDGSNVAGTATITISNQSLNVNELTFQNISIYPNPVQNELFITLNNEQITQVNILDLSGKLVKSINTATNSIGVSNLQSGIYILTIQTQNGISNTRFVKK